jgi:hypothetical protein
MKVHGSELLVMVYTYDGLFDLDRSIYPFNLF